MKRFLAMLLCVALIGSTTQVLAKADTLIVGHLTKMSGNFFAEGFGNNTADLDVRGLLHDYQLVSWKKDGAIELNPSVVEKLTKIPDPNGNIEYRIQIKPGLRYSDGSPITAKDYVFSALLLSSPEMKKLGKNAPMMEFFLDYQEYSSGASSAHRGVKLENPNTFSLIVSKDKFPYYYDMACINLNPFPLSEIAPGCEVKDEGQGAFIEGPFTEELLQKTLLDEKEGYVSHPKVTSGPYSLESFDMDSGLAVLNINPYYKGNFVGKKPTIKRLVFKTVQNETLLEDLQNGNVDLVNKVSSGDVILKGLDLKQKQVLNATGYPRTGGTFLSFACDQLVPQSLAVRQALASCIDRKALCDRYLKGFGEAIYAYYGLGQWMAAALGTRLEELNLFPYDLGKAAKLLDEDGWTLDEKGEAYAGQGLRYKKINGELQALLIRATASEQNEAADISMELLKTEWEKLGGKLDYRPIPAQAFFRQYYRLDERKYDLLFLGSNFSYLFDPYITYHTGDEFQGVQNTTGLKDSSLSDLALALRQVEPGDEKGYLEAFMAFQQRYAELVPAVALYSNTYYDFFTPALENYHPELFWSWGAAIIEATLK